MIPITPATIHYSSDVNAETDPRKVAESGKPQVVDVVLGQQLEDVLGDLDAVEDQLTVDG